MANVDTIVTLESGVEHPSSGQKENTTVGGDTLHSDIFLQIPFLTKDEASIYTIRLSSFVLVILQYQARWTTYVHNHMVEILYGCSIGTYVWIPSYK